MSSDNAEAPFSYTVKTPAGNLFTIRGDNYDEFYSNLNAVAKDPEVTGVLAEIQGTLGHAAAEVVDRSPARSQRSEPSRGDRGRPDPGPDNDSDNACKHGERVLKSGNKNGRDWSGYFCPANDKMCKPVWNK